MSRGNRTARRLRRSLALLGLLVLLLVGFTGWQALQAKTEFEKVAQDFAVLGGHLASGNQAAARSAVADAQLNARASVRHTRGPGWWVSARLPQIGPNVEAVRTVAMTSQRLADGVLPDVVATADTLSPDSLGPVDGRIDLAPLEASRPAVVRAASRLATESDRVQGIDPSRLAPQIARPVEEDLRTRIAHAADLADRASRIVRLLPPMLGGHGRRTYLFLFQNNAEVRATGGIPGAFATITADRGRLTLGRQDDATTIGSFRRPPTPLTAEERAVFGPGLGRFPQDVNFTPDFPRSAQLISGMYRASNGRRVDGVVSADPVALSYLLKGTGPVRTKGGRELTADNAVQLLLSQVYADIPVPARQNVFFNAAARSVFEAVSSGTGEPRELLDGLVSSVSERRLLVWSARPSEQRLLAPTALAGGLATRDRTSPQVGVYLNAALPYKLDYYLDHEASVRSACVDGRQRLTTTLQLHSNVPSDLSGLSDYVAPRRESLFRRGTIAVTVYFLAPEAGSVSAVHVDGTGEEPQRQSFDGRTIFARTITLKPGERRSLTVDAVAGPGQTGTTDLRTTPGVRSTGIGTVQASACS